MGVQLGRMAGLTWAPVALVSLRKILGLSNSLRYSFPIICGQRVQMLVVMVVSGLWGMRSEHRLVVILPCCRIGHDGSRILVELSSPAPIRPPVMHTDSGVGRGRCSMTLAENDSLDARSDPLQVRFASHALRCSLDSAPDAKSKRSQTCKPAMNSPLGDQRIKAVVHDRLSSGSFVDLPSGLPQ